MASNDFGRQLSQGNDALHAGDAEHAQPNSAANDLKGLLNAIVGQISEADRRHTETLQQMHERLTGIGRETKSIKTRVPGQFAAAFERIETGMAELASRISEASGDPSAPALAVAHSLDEPYYRAVSSPQVPAMFNGASAHGEPPVALRSASDASSSAVSRVHSGVDTFDVIESSPPVNVTDPWDHESAEALTGLYESGTSGFKSKAFSPALTASHVAAPSSTTTPAAGADHVWLESRFADVSKRIEESLNDIRPDQGFFALGQRVDQLEQHFSNLFEGVATRGDVEGVRLIEAHVSEMADHLENAQNQLMRLDVIEVHLAGIATKLDDVHRAASVAGDFAIEPGVPSSNADMHEFARTAAAAAAHELSKIQSPAHAASETKEIGHMLRNFIAESRQGEENTTALLDTLQQAMIRLLDRVDAMELSALQSQHGHANAQAQVHSAPADYIHEHARYTSNTSDSYHSDVEEPFAAIDAAVAAVAHARATPAFVAPMAGASELEPLPAHPSNVDASVVPQRSPDKIRQDFIAEARRAKMRLAEEAPVATEATPASMSADPAKSPGQPARGTHKPANGTQNRKQASVDGAQRVKVLALSAMLALGGIWLAKESGLFTSAALIAATPATDGQADGSKSAATGAPAANPADASSGALLPSSGTPEGGPGDLKLPEGTRGEILSDDTVVGSAMVPMNGVAVDSQRRMTAEDLARARRQHAMAAVSGKLGEVAQRNTAETAIPAALDPNTTIVEGKSFNQNAMSISNSGMSQSAALDLPPATVGPLSLRLAAANGDASAEFEVGARLAEGKGTEQTFKDAAKWYQRSASKGFAQAQYRLGTLYERGLGLKVDVERAQEWYTRAAEQGNVKAMHNLAVLSANQSKATPDYTTAAQWFQKAADYGLADSQFNLAVLNENGLGVPEDLVAAYKWLALSAKSGDKEAVRRRDILKGKLTAEQLTAAEGLVATWRAKRSDPEINDARKAGEAWKKNPDNGVNG